QQFDGNPRQCERGQHVERGLRRAALLAAEQQHCHCREQRQQDRREDQVIRPTHASGSLPSTWSVPVRPRAANSTTRNSAVVAKLITIAVSTSACGKGSMYCDGSPLAASRRTGGKFTCRRPMLKMNRLIA